MDSDSDDNLEVVSFLPKQSKSPRINVTPVKSNEFLATTDTSSRLDALLSEHREETEKAERLKKVKLELQSNIVTDTSEETNEQVETELAPELAKVIDDLSVKASELPAEHPTVQVFNQNRFCCLFGEDIQPFLWGFSPSSSEIDKLLARVIPDEIVTMLLSEVISTCCLKISDLHSVMMWLYSIVSIHSSELVVEAGSKNLISILQKLKFSHLEKSKKCWCPTPLQLMTIFVNMGASPSELLINQNLYTDEEVRNYMSEFSKKDKEELIKPGCVGLNNCRQLFDVLARCLQSRPEFSKTELNAILVMIMKVSIDDTFKNLDLQRQFQVCISSVLECYTESDWPVVVPELCHQISSISHHHHSAVYLNELLPMGERGKYIQIRLSFLMLCNLLSEEENINLNLHSPNISLVSITELGYPEITVENEGSSKLTETLQSLIKTDVYKMRSVLQILDRAVGDEQNRRKQPKDEMDYLINELKQVIKCIRDSVFGLDLIRIKDIMATMTDKWTVSAQQSKSVQRSIFPWVTATTHVPVKEVELEDSLALSSEEEMEEEK